MLNETINSLNQNAGALQVVFAFVVAISTLVYAILTWRLVAETRRMRRAQTDAKMTVGVETRPEWLNFIDLWVRNEGMGPAYDISFEIENLNPEGSEEVVGRVREYGCLKYGLRYASPGQEYRTFLCSLVGDKAKMKTKVRIYANYRTAAGERHKDEYVLDFSVFEGTHQLGKPPLHKMAKDIESMAKDVGHLTSGFKKPHVLIQSKEDYDRQMDEWYAQQVEKSGSPRQTEGDEEEDGDEE